MTRGGLGVVVAAVALLASLAPAAAAPAGPAGPGRRRSCTCSTTSRWTTRRRCGTVRSPTRASSGAGRFVTQAIAMLGELPERPERAALVERARPAARSWKASAPATTSPGWPARSLGGDQGLPGAGGAGAPARPASRPQLYAPAAPSATAATAAATARLRGGWSRRDRLPRPRAPRPPQRVRALHSTLTLGVAGTAMTASRSLEEQRWGLALHVAARRRAVGAAARAACGSRDAAASSSPTRRAGDDHRRRDAGAAR